MSACQADITTASIQTPPGKGGIAVIALRGNRTAAVISDVFQPAGNHGRGGEDILQLGRLIFDGRVIDEAVVRAGDGWAEIDIHGGPAAAQAAMAALAALGAAVAGPVGDLPTRHPRWNNPAIGAEMLDALPRAASETVLAALTCQWSDGISELARRAMSACDGRKPGGDRLGWELRRASQGLELMSRLLTPPEVVLAGPPNAGKSTLANALVGRQVSIVHDAPGTTRDWIRELSLLSGLPVWITDTAGIWEDRRLHAVDSEAVRRAKQCVRQADLVVLLQSGQDAGPLDWLAGPNVLRAQAKCDISAAPIDNALPISALTGQGMAELRQGILLSLGLGSFDPIAARAFTARQAELLERAAGAIDAADAATAAAAIAELLGA